MGELSHLRCLDTSIYKEQITTLDFKDAQRDELMQLIVAIIEEANTSIQDVIDQMNDKNKEISILDGILSSAKIINDSFIRLERLLEQREVLENQKEKYEVERKRVKIAKRALHVKPYYDKDMDCKRKYQETASRIEQYLRDRKSVV